MESNKNNNIMKKLNWFTNVGIGLIMLTLILKFLNLQHNSIFFVQGFSIGLGIILIVKGFFINKKRTSLNCE